jgi:hypothetical protein
MPYVNVPVPEHLVPEVMALIVARTTGGGTGSQATPEAQPATNDWSVAEVRKLWGESGAPVRQTLQLLAQNGGKPVGAQDIARMLGKSDRGHAVAGMMGALGRRLKHRHDGRWPFTAQWNAVEARWEYTMAMSVASTVESVVSEQLSGSRRSGQESP